MSINSPYWRNSQGSLVLSLPTIVGINQQLKIYEPSTEAKPAEVPFPPAIPMPSLAK